MGYTHYWTPKQEYDDEKWHAFIEDCKVVLASEKMPPLDIESCDENGISLDGAGDSGYEQFTFGRVSGFNFCKTARQPYDLAVAAVLVLAGHHLGDAVDVSSDGNPKEWQAAVELVRDILGYGDFPFTEADIMEQFCEPYNERYVEDLKRLRTELGIKTEVATAG